MQFYQNRSNYLLSRSNDRHLGFYIFPFFELEDPGSLVSAVSALVALQIFLFFFKPI